MRQLYYPLCWSASRSVHPLDSSSIRPSVGCSHFSFWEFSLFHQCSCPPAWDLDSCESGHVLEIMSKFGHTSKNIPRCLIQVCRSRFPHPRRCWRPNWSDWSDDDVFDDAFYEVAFLPPWFWKGKASSVSSTCLVSFVDSCRLRRRLDDSSFPHIRCRLRGNPTLE